MGNSHRCSHPGCTWRDECLVEWVVVGIVFTAEEFVEECPTSEVVGAILQAGSVGVGGHELWYLCGMEQSGSSLGS